MKITVAKTAGFCFGVRNALQIAHKAGEDHPEGIYTYGPLIHNEDVIRRLEQQHIHACSRLCEIPEGSTVVVRAHGIGKAEYEQMQRRHFQVVDATCPYVAKIHRLVQDYSAQGYPIIILGDAEHPEVRGIQGWCSGPVLVYADLEEIRRDPPDPSRTYVLIEQTTFDALNFQSILEFFKAAKYNTITCHTICTSTIQHQQEARKLASASDLMVVIGGRHSSNTQKLFSLCVSQCPRTFFVESVKELEGIEFGHDVLTVGITAGASTPDYLIQEVVRKMSENTNFEELLNESFQEIHSGDVVQGTVAQVTDNEIVFNIGYKCDGTMTPQEFGGTDAPLTEQVKVGDVMDVKVIKVGDMEVSLSRRRVIQDEVFKELEDAQANGTVLTGKVVKAQDNGIVVDYHHVHVFIPASLCNLRRIDLNTLVDQEVEFKVIRVQRKRGRVLGDRRSVLAEKRDALRAETIQKLVPGARLTGTVKNITNYCAFVDLGGIDGMLHISEMGWSAVRNPAKYVKEGDVIEVGVKSYDPETNRISLTTKFPETNPWNGAEEKYAVGNIVTGKVVRFTDFGAFVELEKGIDALIHISQLSHKFVKHPSEVLNIGDEIQAQVIDFNPETKRISLSLRALEPVDEPAAQEQAEQEQTPVQEAPENETPVQETPVQEAEAEPEQARQDDQPQETSQES